MQIKELLYKTVDILSLKQKLLCGVVFILLCFGSILECFGVSIIIPLVETIRNPEIVTSSLWIDIIPGKRNITPRDLSYYICACVIFVYILKNMYFIFLSWIKVKFSCKIQREMSVHLLKTYLSRGYQYFLDVTYGELYSGIAGDVSVFYNYIVSIFKLFSETFTIICISIFMLYTDSGLAISMIIMSSFCIIAINLIFKKRMFLSGEKYRKYMAEAGQALTHTLQGVKDVLAYRKQSYFIDDYQVKQSKMQQAQCVQAVGAESPAYIIEALCVTGILVVVGLRLKMWGGQEQFISVLASFAVGAFRILPSLGRISSALNTISSAIPSLNSLHKEFSEERRKQQLKIEDCMEEGNIHREYEKVTLVDNILINNISFRYDRSRDDVISCVSLDIKKGQSVAIIGESGSGKSTFVDCVLGLLKPQSGVISYDNKNILDHYEEWSTIVGYVSQSIYLIEASILDNVAYGIPHEKVDINRAKKALEKADLMDYINTLPDGINTNVGDRGVKLSGGQRQRIAIARALYKKPQVLVLDEATSALDNETENVVMKSIEALYGELTMIVVAHRITTVKKCDVIYEIKKGKLEKVEKDLLF